MRYIVQKFIPGRRGQWIDWCSYTDGVAAFNTCAAYTKAGAKARVHVVRAEG